MNAWDLAPIAAVSLIATGVVLLAFLLILKRRSTARARRGTETAKLDETAKTQEIHALMSELEQLALRIDERIELRMSQLRQLLTEADERIAQIAEKCPEENVLDPRDRYILRLNAQGVDPIEIARRMQMNVGEVELVVNLHASRLEPG